MMSRSLAKGTSVPVYQYACTECGEQLEVRQSFTDAALTECPACEGRLRKVLNAVGVVFKGSGFYRNDSRAATMGARAGSGHGRELPASGHRTVRRKHGRHEPYMPLATSPARQGRPAVACQRQERIRLPAARRGSSDKSGGAKPTPAAAPLIHS